jgi:hypothetical protein
MNISPDIIAQMTPRTLDVIEYFIFHHSVAAQDIDIAQIAEMEIDAQGFLTIGYNGYMVRKASGWVIQSGRPIDRVPAAAYGLNTQSYDLCIAGNYQPNVPGVPTDAVDPQSLKVAIARIDAVKQLCPNLKYLIGHRDVAKILGAEGKNPADYSTACPGDLLQAHLHDLRVATGLHSPPALL